MPVRYSDQSSGPETRRAQGKPDVVDYWSWTKPELKAEAEKRGLPTYGTKADLIWRLEQ